MSRVTHDEALYGSLEMTVLPMAVCMLHQCLGKHIILSPENELVRYIALHVCSKESACKHSTIYQRSNLHIFLLCA